MNTRRSTCLFCLASGRLCTQSCFTVFIVSAHNVVLRRSKVRKSDLVGTGGGGLRAVKSPVGEYFQQNWSEMKRAYLVVYGGRLSTNCERQQTLHDPFLLPPLVPFSIALVLTWALTTNLTCDCDGAFCFYLLKSNLCTSCAMF